MTVALNSLQVSNEIIRRCTSTICLDDIFDGRIQPSLTALHESIQCCESWKETYARVSIMVVDYVYLDFAIHEQVLHAIKLITDLCKFTKNYFLVMNFMVMLLNFIYNYCLYIPAVSHRSSTQIALCKRSVIHCTCFRTSFVAFLTVNRNFYPNYCLTLVTFVWFRLPSFKRLNVFKIQKCNTKF